MVATNHVVALRMLRHTTPIFRRHASTAEEVLRRAQPC